MEPVDLITGIGGTMGLWLGLSLFSLGTFVIHSVRSLARVEMF